VSARFPDRRTGNCAEATVASGKDPIMPRNLYITAREAAHLSGCGVGEIHVMRGAGLLPNSRFAHGALDVCLSDLVFIGLVEAPFITGSPTQSARCRRGAIKRDKRRADRYRIASR
jgi:hypothetical protein